MAVKENKLSAVDKQKENEEQESAEDKLKEGILGNMDLSKELEEAGEVEEEKKEESAEEESEEEEDDDDATYDDDEDDEDEEEEDEEGEETVAKSKVQKRIDKLVSENKRLQRELEAKEEEKSLAESNDPDTVKLNAMSDEALKATRKAVIKAIKTEDDEETLDQLLDLQDKVDEAIRTQPDRFVGQQIAEYNKVAEHIVSLAEIPQTEESATQLKEIAREIFNSSPELKTSKTGQARALQLAYNHYKVLLSKGVGKDKNDSLKRQVNTLKRKTSLDSTGRKQKSGNKAVLAKLREKAGRGGTYSDKTNLIKADPRFNIDSMIPAEYREE